MLKRITYASDLEDKALLAYQKLMMGIIVDHDIGAQETCRMFQNLPLISCSWSFVYLNVGRKIL